MKPSKLIRRRQFWRLVGLLVLDGLLFGGFNAQQAPSFVMIVGLLALAATAYCLFYGLLSAARLYGLKLRRRRLAAVLTALCIGLLALQSIGELSPRDVAVLLPLAIIGYLYSFYGLRGRDAYHQA